MILKEERFQPKPRILQLDHGNEGFQLGKMRFKFP